MGTNNDTYIEKVLNAQLNDDADGARRLLPEADKEHDDLVAVVGDDGKQKNAMFKLGTWLKQFRNHEDRMARSKAQDTLDEFQLHLKQLLKNTPLRSDHDSERNSHHMNQLQSVKNDQSKRNSGDQSRDLQQKEEVRKAERDRNILERSKQAGQALRQNNPDIADLSDSNRPTKLAERFSELYDNEWTEAFEGLTKSEMDDKGAISLLLQIVQTANSFSKTTMHDMMKTLTSSFDTRISGSDKTQPTEEGRQLLVQLLKEEADTALPNIKKKFKTEVEKICRGAGRNAPTIGGVLLKLLLKYADQAVELCWLMIVQDPPVYMCPTDIARKADFDPNLYRAYTKTGKRLAFYVWPALKLHEKGALLYKGVAQMTV
ncbi:uncharacterized protein LOC128228799 [Mya arenaria]|uniref:uncharacterized protein LOC128228799 n=1 Tax=Mya arenaria TaxID=6604 RepID=UPI0022DFBA34|nr:uncharacterized protein LOC128228799 [Mya arenaria]